MAATATPIMTRLSAGSGARSRANASQTIHNPIATSEVTPFATDRFLVELDRLESCCARDFKGAGSLLTRRRSTLAALFFDTVALQVVHVFEVADREVRAWLTAFMRPLENRFTRTTGKSFFGAYPGTYPFVGTPDEVASEMARMSAAGLAGTSVAFLDYLKEIPYFVQEVLPRLERLGLRRPPTAT